jgi:cytochrome P450
MSSDPYYDPYDYQIDEDPHPVWRRLREEAPLYRNERYDFWALSRFQDVLSASLDDDTFSSAYGTVLEIMTDEPNILPIMIFKDKPEHTQLRKLVSRAFSPKRIAALESSIRELCRQYLDPQVGRSGFDYLEDFGARLPVMVISSMLGVPESDREDIRHWTDTTLHWDGSAEGGAEAQAEARRSLLNYFARYVAERRKVPRDDMMTDLLEAEIELDDGSKRRLDDEQVISFIGLLSGAGNETVARFLGNFITILARFPEERRKLVGDFGRIPRAVEELLRYEAPSPVQARRAQRDIVLHGETVPRGAKVLLLTGSAGRDDREYPDPERFDVDRRFDRHVSLGLGVHYCLGASLARLEARIAIEETLRRFPEWEVHWKETERVHTSTVRGYAKVPIRL